MADRCEIRAGRAEDAIRVIEMYAWLFEPPGVEPPDWDPDAARRRWLEAAAAEDSLALVAELRGGELAGLCTAYIDLESVRYGVRCWVEDLAVDPAQRSLGIGAALFGSAKKWARSRGATHLELDSGEGRTEAHRFYEREGGGWRSYSYSWWLA
jgi:GNAT superfamily N-acetyltransferase